MEATKKIRTVTVQSRTGVKSVDSPYSNDEALNLLPKGDSFALDIKAQFEERGFLSDKQWAWVHVLACESQDRLKVSQEVGDSPTTSTEGILKLFKTAAEHLKKPKIRLSLNGVEYVLSPAGRLGWLNLKIKGGNFVGQIDDKGTLRPRVSLDRHPGLLDLLQELAKNPAEVAAEYGRLTSNCCFCGKDLSDPRSVKVGWGKICSQHFGLPWGEKENGEVVLPKGKAAILVKVPNEILAQEGPQQARQDTKSPEVVPQITTDTLIYEGARKLFSGKTSDLSGEKHGPSPKVVEVKSVKTGAVKVFQFAEETYDEAEELWTYFYTCNDLNLALTND